MLESLEGRRLLAAITSATWDFGGTSQGINYAFDAPVGNAAVLDALSLVDLAHNSAIPHAQLAITSTGATSARVSWPGLATANAPAGVLADGHYEAIVEDDTGSPFNSPSVLPFAFYRGDLDGDTDVDMSDFNLLASHFGESGTYAQGDINYNGTVTVVDFNVLAAKFGTKLVPLPVGDNVLTGGAGSDEVINLNFSPPTDPATGVASTLFTGFRVYRSPDGVNFTQVSSDDDETLLNSGATVYSFADWSVSDGTKYWYRVRPYNADGTNGAPTGIWHTTNKIWAVTVLPTPWGLSSTNTTPTSVSLAWWDYAGHADRIEIERRLSSGGTYTQVGTVAPSVTTFTDTTAQAGTTYEYRIRASNAVNTSMYGDEAEATTPLSRATTGNGLTASYSNVVDGIKLMWTLPAGVDPASVEHVLIERQHPNAGSWQEVAQLSNASTWTDQTVERGNDYAYRVRVYTDGSNGSPDEVLRGPVTVHYAARPQISFTSDTLTISWPIGQTPPPTLIITITDPATGVTRTVTVPVTPPGDRGTGNKSSGDYVVPGLDPGTHYLIGFDDPSDGVRDGSGGGGGSGGGSGGGGDDGGGTGGGGDGGGTGGGGSSGGGGDGGGDGGSGGGDGDASSGGSNDSDSDAFLTTRTFVDDDVAYNNGLLDSTIDLKITPVISEEERDDPTIFPENKVDGVVKKDDESIGYNFGNLPEHTYARMAGVIRFLPRDYIEGDQGEPKTMLDLKGSVQVLATVFGQSAQTSGATIPSLYSYGGTLSGNEVDVAFTSGWVQNGGSTAVGSFQIKQMGAGWEAKMGDLSLEVGTPTFNVQGKVDLTEKDKPDGKISVRRGNDVAKDKPLVVNLSLLKKGNNSASSKRVHIQETATIEPNKDFVLVDVHVIDDDESQGTQDIWVVGNAGEKKSEWNAGTVQDNLSIKSITLGFGDAKSGHTYKQVAINGFRFVNHIQVTGERLEDLRFRQDINIHTMQEDIFGNDISRNDLLSQHGYTDGDVGHSQVDTNGQYEPDVGEGGDDGHLDAPLHEITSEPLNVEINLKGGMASLFADSHQYTQTMTGGGLPSFTSIVSIDASFKIKFFDANNAMNVLESRNWSFYYSNSSYKMVVPQGDTSDPSAYDEVYASSLVQGAGPAMISGGGLDSGFSGFTLVGDIQTAPFTP